MATNFTRVVSSIVITALLSTVFEAGLASAAYADQIADSANKGKALANELYSGGYTVDSQSDGSRTIYYRDKDGNPTTLDLNNQDMWGGETVNGQSDWQDLQDMESDDAAINQAASDTRDASETSNDARGQAFGTYQDGNKRSRPKLENDPLAVSAARLYSDIESGTANCGVNSEKIDAFETCERSNFVSSCNAQRKVTVTPISITKEVFVGLGCFDHSITEFKVAVPNAYDVEMQGYYEDVDTGLKYYEDPTTGEMAGVPPHLVRYSPPIYGHLQRQSGTHRYGVHNLDINEAYPEVNYSHVSTRGGDPGDDTMLSYVRFSPIDLSTIEGENSQFTAESISSSVSVKHYMRGGGSVYVLQEPSPENDWTLRIRYNDDGNNGKRPACAQQSAYNPARTGFPGAKGTAWADTRVEVHMVGYVVTEIASEAPGDCIDSLPSGCTWSFQCNDDTPRLYSGYTEEELRPYMSPLFPGDDPTDTSQPVCYSASATTSCTAESYGYDPAKSCTDQQSRQECAFVDSECAVEDADGKCVYFNDKYNCGHNPDHDPNCSVRQQVIDEFSACERSVTYTTTTQDYYLDEPASCEVIRDLTSCQRTRGRNDVTGDFSDTDTPNEPGNNPCIESPDGFVLQADWTCNTRVPVPNGLTFPALYPGDDGSCVNATVQYDTSWYYQSMDCYEDINGDTVCPQGNSSNVDKNTCDELDAQGCAQTSSQCVEGAQASNGFCFAEEYSYDCGNNVQVENTTYESEWDCPGPLNCAGESCVDVADEENDGFNEAVAAMNAVQFAGQDTICDDAGNCTIFSGEAYECKKALGGYQDCCVNPGGPGLAEYITMLYATGKMTAANTNIAWVKASGEAITGAWKAMKDPVVQGFHDLTGQYFTSQAEGGLRATGSALTGKTMTTKSAEFIGDVFGDQIRDFVFEAGAEGSYQLAPWAGTAATWAGYMMTAYMIYSLAVLTVQIVWKCEEEEYELGSKKELRVCHKVGSYCKTEVLGGCVEKREAYCCYNSPLGRIISEQAYPQLGRSYGSPKNPRCEGMTMTEFANLDWSQINLDEWIAMLGEAGLSPKADPSDLKQQYSIEALTGKGNKMSAGEDRDNSLEFTWDRQPDDPSNAYRNIETDLSGQE